MEDVVVHFVMVELETEIGVGGKQLRPDEAIAINTAGGGVNAFGENIESGRLDAFLLGHDAGMDIVDESGGGGTGGDIAGGADPCLVVADIGLEFAEPTIRIGFPTAVGGGPCHVR